MKTYQKHKITICYNLSKDLCFGGLKTHHKRTKGQGKHRQYLARIGNCEKKKKPSDRLHNRLQASHATEWNRTIDLHLTMVLLYRLSYSGYIVLSPSQRATDEDLLCKPLSTDWKQCFQLYRLSYSGL